MNSKHQGEREIRPHRDLLEFYGSREERAEFVSQLFDNTARHYDWISGALSFGTGSRYRKTALHRAGLKPGMRLLDVATGTGLVAEAALGLGISSSDLIGLDPSRGMLTENRQRRAISLVQGRGESLPFPDRTFDFISMGYALRHVEDLRLLFGEFRRVLRPGGRLLILEISRPESRLAFAFARVYMGIMLPALVRLFTSGPEAGRLIEFYWATIAECVSPKTIVDALTAAGLTEVERRKLGGMLNDYLAQNP
jgi:demethylmenaquinone methyltransferase / 2-methoxy-6-polyprenyl-1,4-benzoquinol methylase